MNGRLEGTLGLPLLMQLLPHARAAWACSWCTHSCCRRVLQRGLQRGRLIHIPPAHLHFREGSLRSRLADLGAQERGQKQQRLGGGTHEAGRHDGANVTGALNQRERVKQPLQERPLSLHAGELARSERYEDCGSGGMEATECAHTVHDRGGCTSQESALREE